MKKSFFLVTLGTCIHILRMKVLAIKINNMYVTIGYPLKISVLVLLSCFLFSEPINSQISYDTIGKAGITRANQWGDMQDINVEPSEIPAQLVKVKEAFRTFEIENIRDLLSDPLIEDLPKITAKLKEHTKTFEKSSKTEFYENAVSGYLATGEYQGIAEFNSFDDEIGTLTITYIHDGRKVKSIKIKYSNGTAVTFPTAK